MLNILKNNRGQILTEEDFAVDPATDLAISSIDESGSEPTEEGLVDEAALREDRRRLKLWRKRIGDARKLRKDWEKDFRVRECEEYYLGNQYNALPDNSGVINNFLATIRVTLPNLVFDDPKFLVRAKPGTKSPAASVQARSAEGVLESVSKQDDNLRNASRFSVLQNFFRIAVIKVCYDPKLEPNPKAGEPIYKQDASGNIVMDPEFGTPIPEIDPETGMPMPEPELVMSDEVYRFEWVDTSNFLLPDEGPDKTKWTWVGEEIEVSLADAKADERFPPELRAAFKPTKLTDDEDAKTEVVQDNGDADTYPEDEKFCYTVIYDKRDRKMLIVAKDNSINAFLYDGPLPDGVEDHPYAILPGWIPNIGPDGGSPWPVPYTKDWLDLQDEYNLRRLQMRNGAQRSARKVLAMRTMFENEEEARKACQSSTDMELVYVKDMTKIPAILAEPDINPAIYKDAVQNLTDWRLITGQTGAKIGQPDADSATEATFVQQASNLRDADLQKDVNAFFREAGRKMLQLIRDTLTLEMWVDIRGMEDNSVALYLSSVYGIPPEMMAMFPELKEALVQRFGQNKIERVTRNDLMAEFKVDVVPGSTKPRSLAVERTQWLEFLSIIAKAPQLALSRMLLEETAAKYDFINPAMVEEVHALAMTMIQMSQMQAGRQGGEGSDSQNTKGSSQQKQTGKVSATARGNEVEE